MRLRSFCAIQTFISLLTGLLIYLLFRNNTFLHQAVPFVPDLFSDSRFFGDWFIRFYLPDGLWSYSLCAALCALYYPKGKGVWLCVLFSVLFGAIWEAIQLSGNVPGTSDVIDILVYFTGAMLFGLVYIKRRGQKK